MADQSQKPLVGQLTAQKAVVAERIEHLHVEAEKRPIPRMAPPAPRVFVGRDEVLRELLAALKLGEDGGGPIALTALKGMGGIGKTTLAAALANHPEVETALPDGTLWAGLGPEPEVMSLLAEWGAALGGDFAQLDSPEARSRRLSSLLHTKKALLIVDDVWDAETARHFLVGGSECRTLITTRDNEIARKLAGRETVGVETLTNTASLNLLRELAPEAIAADEKAANELASELDGLPLALTLAGQMLVSEWEAGLGVSGALSELKDREARLQLSGAQERAGWATTEPSLQAILAMSYDRLPDEATKRAFRLLGLFGGKPLTFSMEAAAAVWEMEPRPAQKTMVMLVGRALIEPVDGGRYTLHTTLADFAESLLEEHGEAAPARETHAKYYLEFAQKNARKNWLAVEVEMEQIRRGFDWESMGSDEKQMVLEYEQALRSFFTRRGLWNEKIRWSRIALEVARAQDKRELEAQLLNEISYSHDNTGKWDDALKASEQSRAIFEEAENQVGLAQSFIRIGMIYNRNGSWDEALEYFERSQKIWEEIDNRSGLAESYDCIGRIYKNKGLWDEALKCYEHSRAIREKIYDRSGMAHSLGNIGICYKNKGSWDEALEFLNRSRTICDEIGDRVGLAGALHMIGGVYKNKGLWNDALAYYERCQAIREQIGQREMLAWTLWHMADVYEAQERLAEVEQLLTQAATIFEQLGSPYLDDARKKLDKVRELQQTASQK